MPNYVIPSEFFFWAKNSQHIAHKQALLPQVQASLAETEGQQKGAWFCDVNTEFFSKTVDISKYIPLITEAVYPALDQMFTEVLGLRRPHSSTVHSIWYNYYAGAGRSGQEIHTHTGCTYSGIYFLELNETNKTMFFSHLASVNQVTPSTNPTDFISEGDILLFPATLMHYVLPSDRPRTTIAFNVSCSYET